MNIIRRKATAKKVGVTTVTIDRWSSDPKYAHLNFPKPIPVGPNTRGWDVAELDAYDESRRALRGQAREAAR